MEQAQCCLQQAAQCYKNCFNDDFGCNLEDYGYSEDDDNDYDYCNENYGYNNNHGYNNNCGCNR